nr:hypothetical protein [Tanacetum cinerariifolium]
MDITIDQQVAMDEALVPHAKRLNVSQIYMQEFWVTATVHHHSIQFKMDNKKHIVNLKSFSAVIKKLTDVNINKLHQPWRAFAAIINKCLTGKSLGYDSLRLSQAQILWGLYYKRNVEFAYLMWEDFVYQLKLVTKRSLQQTHISQASGSGANEGTGSIPGVPDVPTDESEEEISWNSIDEEGDDDKRKDGDDDNGDDEDEGGDDEQASDEEEFIHLSLSTHTKEETRDEESFVPIPKTPENSDDEGNGEEDLDLNVGREEGHNEKEEEDELYRDVNINQGRGIQTTQEVKDSHVTLTPVNPDGQQQSSSVSTHFVTSMLNPTPDAGMESIFETTSQMDVHTSTSFAGAVSTILGIVQQYMDQRMNEAVKVAVQLQSNRLRDEAQADNDEFLKTIDENMQKIIKEQVKEQVKTSYVVVADLSEMELKKILIEKIEGNKSIHRSNKQRNLCNALVEAYESDKIILDTYGETVMLKRRLDDDADKDKEPSTSASESATVDEPMQTTFELEDPAHPEFKTGADDQPIVESIQPWIKELAKQSDSRSSFNELMDTPVDFSNFLINRLRVDILTPKLLSGPTYELIKGSCKVEFEYQLEEVYKATTDQLDWVNPEGQQYPHNLLKPLPLIPNNRVRRVIPFDHFINNELEYLRGDLVPRTIWIQEPIGYDKHALWGISHWGRKRQQFYSFAVNWESARDVYSKRRIIIVTELKIVEWHNYKHLDWITRKSDKDRAAAMIQAIDKRLKTRRIMWILERYSIPMIQSELEGSTLGYPLVSVEVLRSILTDSQVTPTNPDE